MNLRVFLSDVVFSPVVIVAMLSSIYLSFLLFTELILGKENVPGVNASTSLIILLIGYLIIFSIHFMAYLFETFEVFKDSSPIIMGILVIVALVMQFAGFYSPMEGIIMLLFFVGYLVFSSYIFAKGQTQSIVYGSIIASMSILYLTTHFTSVKEWFGVLILI